MPTLPALTTQPSPAPVWAGTATPVADIVRPTDPEISQGWPLTAIPPSRQRFNWVLNRLSAGLRYIEQHGIGKWQVEEDYGGFPRTRGDRPDFRPQRVRFEVFPPHPRG